MSSSILATSCSPLPSPSSPSSSRHHHHQDDGYTSSSSTTHSSISTYTRNMYAHTKRQMEAATKMARRRMGDGSGGSKKGTAAEGPNALAACDSVESEVS